MTKKRLPGAPYPDVDDALADTTRGEPATGSGQPPGAVPGEDADVRPLIDERGTAKTGPATADFPQTPLARDPLQ